VLLFLISKITQWEDQYSFTLVSEIFVNLLSVQTQKNILFTFCNPFKILCLIYEIFNHALTQEVQSKSNILECLSKYEKFIYKYKIWVYLVFWLKFRMRNNWWVFCWIRIWIRDRWCSLFTRIILFRLFRILGFRIKSIRFGMASFLEISTFSNFPPWYKISSNMN